MDGQHVITTGILSPLIAGGIAGLSVDVTLYPLDTLKTRLQSEQGFQKAGGFRGVYKGLSAVMVGSMPTSALFFLSYEKTKTILQPHVDMKYAPVVHMCAASIGEVVACIFRVPMEIAKQRKQTYIGTIKKSNISILADAYKSEGVRYGLYRGFLSTVARDLPFSFIEMPVWEYLKNLVRQRNGGQINSFESAICGSLAGGFAAAVTTPLDVIKTRIMLSADGTANLRVATVFVSILRDRGFSGLFAGLTPRVTAFTAGGFVFFGAYDYAKAVCDDLL